MGNFSLVQTIVIWALPVLLAITVHEAAHGYVANRLGDSTARMLGRLTLNPIRHVDPVGTVLVPGLLILLGSSFLFGWAKPVPVNTRNLPNPRRDMALVAVAGPASNLVMALGWALLLRLAVGPLADWEWVALPLNYMAQAGILINLVLMALNLIPGPPLDGGRVAVGVLPIGAARSLSAVEPYGLYIVLGLLVTGLLGKLIGPIIGLFGNIIYTLFGLGRLF